jgi:hypothetical protein
MFDAKQVINLDILGRNPADPREARESSEKIRGKERCDNGKLEYKESFQEEADYRRWSR